MADIDIVYWKKILTMGKADIVRFQIAVHCHVQRIHISPADLDCLTLLGQEGEAELTAFCESLAEKDIFKTAQSARNALTRLQDKDLVIKEGRSRKKVYLHPSVQLQKIGNVMVDVKCFSPAKDLQ